MIKIKNVILGAGLSGLSLAYFMNNDVSVYEKENHIGGYCNTHKINGFTFDYAGHLLHLKNEFTQKLVMNLLADNIHKQRRDAWIFSKDTYSKYPFQANTQGLPPWVIRDCLVGAIDAYYSNKKNPENFYEWILQSFGNGVAEHFMVPYNQKLWNTHPKDMTCEWLDKFIPKPNIKEIIDGALGLQSSELGYNSEFWYPIEGGIMKLPNAFAAKLGNIHLNSEIEKIDSKQKKIYFKDGKSITYDNLISTIPLPELFRLIEAMPNELGSIVDNLDYSSVLAINLGISKPNLTTKHWIYFPESRFNFYRISFPMNFSPKMCPANSSSLSVEISYKKGASIDIPKAYNNAVNHLVSLGMIDSENDIIAKDIVNSKYSYVTFDKFRQKNLPSVHDYLNKNNIYSIGRYGSWNYYSIEETILEAYELSKKLIEP